MDTDTTSPAAVGTGSQWPHPGPAGSGLARRIPECCPCPARWSSFVHRRPSLYAPGDGGQLFIPGSSFGPVVAEAATCHLEPVRPVRRCRLLASGQGHAIPRPNAVPGADAHPRQHLGLVVHVSDRRHRGVAPGEPPHRRRSGRPRWAGWASLCRSLRRTRAPEPDRRRACFLDACSARDGESVFTLGAVVARPQGAWRRSRGTADLIHGPCLVLGVTPRTRLLGKAGTAVRRLRALTGRGPPAGRVAVPGPPRRSSPSRESHDVYAAK